MSIEDRKPKKDLTPVAIQHDRMRTSWPGCFGHFGVISSIENPHDSQYPMAT
jgi:hypothetical protein